MKIRIEGNFWVISDWRRRWRRSMLVLKMKGVPSKGDSETAILDKIISKL